MKQHSLKSESLGIFEFDLTEIVDTYSLKKLIYSHRNEYDKTVKTPVNCWHSDFLIHKKIPEFNILGKTIEGYVNTVADIFNDKSAVHVHFELLESLVGIYSKYDYTEAHTHHGLCFSSCFYLSAENCAPIYFEDYKIETKTGMLLIFPGNLSHRVPVKLESHGERVIFACNFYPFYDSSNLNKNINRVENENY